MKSSTAVIIGAVLIASLAACATRRGPRHVDDVPYAGVPPESDWSRVAQIVPGGEIAVTLKRLQPVVRHFVSADASAVLVLNLADPALPAGAARRLRGMASRHPEHFAAM